MDDRELFDLWENKIKIELTAEIVSSKRSIWSITHNYGHKQAASFLNGCDIDENDMILEVGCGSCHFADYIDSKNKRCYVGLDISERMLALAHRGLTRIRADLYAMPLVSESARIVISIYNLEHLHRLTEAIEEIDRVLHRRGIFIFVIPMEDGILYNFGRNHTSRRYVEKKYGVDYMKIIRKYEHPNTAVQIIERVKERFQITQKRFWPCLLPSVNLNIFGVFKAVKK